MTTQKVRLKDGITQKVLVKKYTRGGSKSPESRFIFVDHKWRSPVWQRVHGYELIFDYTQLLNEYLPINELKSAFEARDFFLKMIPIEDWKGADLVLP